VVLDTNVYISAFNFPQGIPALVWAQALERKYRLLVSPYIVNETGRVLREKFNVSDHIIKKRVRKMTRVAEIIQPTISLKAVPNDPDDNPIIDCAVDGQAHLIVTGDHKHLLPLNPFQGIGIITPIDFLRTLGVSTP
jgi:putative PIN family toxin of toxin-antitoxin system